ncbi:MAG: peptidase T, partial [Treponema sp.]|nr:peptidase T [Treponema sp.]
SSKRAYTVDGGHIGELETECFNAVGSYVTFTGKATHTGSAREGKMINAISMLSSFINNLPPRESPETTDGKDGFFAPIEISGSIESSRAYLLLRDFENNGIEKRKHFVDSLAKNVADAFGGKVEVVHKTQYLNMKNVISEHPEVVDDLVNAFQKSGVEIINTPIRGGTDGSRLTEMGIPTPNIFTGAHNFHSRYEWASLSQMCKSCDVLINLAQLVK